MNPMLKPAIPALLSTTLTGLGCHFSGMTRPDLVIAIVFAAFVSGSVAYGAAFAHAHKVRQDTNKA